MATVGFMGFFAKRPAKVRFKELLEDGLNRDRTLGIDNFPRKVNRFVGALLAWLFLQTTITANQITITMLVLYYAGLTLVALGGFWVALLGFGIVLFGDTLDLADGIVGRRNIADGLRKNTKDRFRVVLLAGYHQEGTPALILFALSIYYMFHTADIIVFLIGCLGALFEIKTFHLFRLRDWIILRSDLGDQYKSVRETKNIFAESPVKQTILKLVSFPLRYLLFGGIVGVALSKTNLVVLKLILLFYGIYVPLRFLAFFAYNYIQFKKIEDSRAEKQ